MRHQRASLWVIPLPMAAALSGSGGPPYSGSNRPNKVSGGRRGSFTPDSAKKLPLRPGRTGVGARGSRDRSGKPSKPLCRGSRLRRWTRSLLARCEPNVRLLERAPTTAGRYLRPVEASRMSALAIPTVESRHSGCGHETLLVVSSSHGPVRLSKPAPRSNVRREDTGSGGEG